MKINITVELPDELLNEFIQHLRDYESPRSDKVHLNMFATSDKDVTAEEMNKMLSNVHPEIPWIRVIPNAFSFPDLGYLKTLEVEDTLDGKQTLRERLKYILKVMNEDRSLAHFMLKNLIDKMDEACH